MPEPKLIVSDLSRDVREDDVTFRIEIYRLKDVPGWTLEVVADVADGETSTIWDKEFDSDRAALDEAVRAIREEGAAAFRSQTDGGRASVSGGAKVGHGSGGMVPLRAE